MRFPRFSSQFFPCESDRSPSPARFPDAARFAPIFAGRRAPDASPSPDAPFFAEFASSLVEAARRLTAPTADVLFVGFGFAPLDDLSRRFERSNDGVSESLLLGDARGARYLFVAPRSTFRLLFDAALGFNVEEICANEALWNDFNVDAQAPLTPFEEEALTQEAIRFAALSPLAVLSSPSTVVAFRPTSKRVALELDDALFYWERRVLRLGDRLFPWTLVFPTRFLVPLADAALPRESTPQTPRSDAPPFPPVPTPSLESSPFSSRSSAEPSQPTPFFPVSGSPSVSPSPASFELAVVVERGETSAETWRRLKPGDVLTTDVPANALFLGLVDDAPRFLCRPGLFRGAAAVQIKTRVDDRE
ncbi:MAG: FliM/FliN family flagellar motor switch protein [Thermoguttaceae bacterium]|nr:FliM/FliN family flagellar motor switch protein [Thermoguttaceae bacterium]